MRKPITVSEFYWTIAIKSAGKTRAERDANRQEWEAAHAELKRLLPLNRQYRFKTEKQAKAKLAYLIKLGLPSEWAYVTEQGDIFF